jgi:hypothetical protein
MQNWQKYWRGLVACFGAAIAEDSGVFGVLGYHLFLWEKYS